MPLCLLVKVNKYFFSIALKDLDIGLKVCKNKIVNKELSQ
jgi:hypothetical protein